jgi:hypothetical protein
MSGAGSNYVRVSFATSTNLVARVTTMSLPSAIPIGDYRIFGRFRASAGTSDFQVQVGSYAPAASGAFLSDTVELVSGTSTSIGTTATMIDLGVVRVGVGVPIDTTIGLDVAASLNTPALNLLVARTAGAATFDVDYLLAIPAQYTYAEGQMSGSYTSFVYDGINDAIYGLTTSGPYTGTPKISTPNSPPSTPQGFTGSLPKLYPNQTTRIHWMLRQAATKATTSSVSISYWPKYLYVRPAST